MALVRAAQCPWGTGLHSVPGTNNSLFLKAKTSFAHLLLFQLDNLTLMEINTSGAFLTQALNHMYKLRTNLQPSESSQSQDF